MYAMLARSDSFSSLSSRVEAPASIILLLSCPVLISAYTQHYAKLQRLETKKVSLSI
jgi:hypothetical protein